MLEVLIIELRIEYCCLFFFFFFVFFFHFLEVWMKKTTCTSFFLFVPQGNENKSTFNSYNLISYHFHRKPRENNHKKIKLNRKRKNKLTDDHGGVIIQLRAASNSFKDGSSKLNNHSAMAVGKFILVLSVQFEFCFILRLFALRFCMKMIWN